MLRSVLVLVLAVAVTGCGESSVDPSWLDAPAGDTGQDAAADGDASLADAPDAAQDTLADTSTADSQPGDTADAVGDSDTGAVDTGNPSDTSPDPCAAVDCAGHGTCVAGACQCEAGWVPQGGTCVSADPCAGVSCGANSRCEAGACVCSPGFVDVGGGTCVAEDPGNPATRSTQTVCARWLADFPTTSSAVYDEGAGVAACDPGTIDPAAHDDAMRRLNLYRWLLGLGPAGVDWNNQANSQAAAFMMDVNNALSHSPPQSWTCYSSEGAAGAGSSNLALGYGHPADTVVGYIRDGNTPSLGHRRWCFNPSLDAVGFGHYGRGGAMHSFGQGSQPEPDFVAYPGPGPFPIDALHGDWSFSRRQGFSDAFTVTVTRISDGANIAVEATDLGSSFGFLATLGIRVLDDVTAGESYRVDVVDGAQSWTWQTTLVDCNAI